ncbi:GST-like protein [Paraburkholderia bannensis]|uniref:GST-like protein n=1 Tax=Paraburkholderia bannensis TaxID=765414 RepID=A0A7W9U2A4_9BURK|nr:MULTISPECIES: glutathione binding-like protein [Paraburkholderia]MBB3260778.1 GST-like protein [Paraburkholderia sp. WP4_3_2]MBB6105683.1 GST-like protein [Paraburkholderia bannensis]
MSDLNAFPISARWPAQHPERIQLYSLPTPNGVKVSIMLEETGLAYEPHLVRFDTNDQLSPEFVSLNPNNKIPAIIDPHGPDGQPLALFESGAILIWLGDKTGQFLAREGRERYETIQWLMFQMGGIGPMFGQLGFFHKFAGKEYEDKRPRERYVAESRRLLGVLEQRLEGRAWLMGDHYTIADIATFPWVRNLVGFYEAGDLVGFKDFKNVQRVLEAFVARPAVKRGLEIPARN